MARYTDCYPGCGGEDCVCCGVHSDHINDGLYPADTDEEVEEEIDDDEL